MDRIDPFDGAADIQGIQRGVSVLFDSLSVVELRALQAMENGRRLGTVSGYFDGEHRDELVKVAAYWSGKAPGVYITLNPALPDLLARSANRAQTWVKQSTKDNEIVQRRWLLIDFDPKRPSGISATDAEHEAALERARQCRTWLKEKGLPDPILADSGNGAHLLYRIDLPNDREADHLIKGALAATAAKWSDATVDVDRSVHNAARICKLYGTLAAKGDATPDRPHRISRMLDVPEVVQVVSRELLQALCHVSQTPEPIAIVLPVVRADGFDIETWLTRHNVPVRVPKEWNGGQLWDLESCPWRPDQKDGGPFVAQFADGTVTAGCHHSKCQGRGWPDLRDIYEPGWREAPSSIQGVMVQVREAADDPHRLARLFLTTRYSHAERWTLCYWRCEWYQWNRIIWMPLADEELRAAITQVIKAEFDRLSRQAQASGQEHYTARKVTTNVVNNVVRALQSLVIVSFSLERPVWLTDNAGHWLANEIVVAQNGLFHLPSLGIGRNFRQDHTPTFFTSNALSYPVTLDCGKPARWLEFLRQLWPDDSESIATLQEWFGYCLTADTRQQKILAIIGPKRSGKGTIGRELRALVGPENVAGPPMASLAINFGLQPLIGKTVAIISDARLGGRTDGNVITERLLSISGEDSLTIDRKNIDPITLRLTTRIVIVSNEIPKLLDSSGALPSRMILLPLTRSFYGKEDVHLTDNLLRELPEIFLWAVDGWRRLHEYGRFCEPASAKVMRSELEELGSPIGAFINECCVLAPDKSIARSELYRAYHVWCQSRGNTHVEDRATFGRNLRAVLPSLDARQTQVTGKRVREYVGIALRPEIGQELEKNGLSE